MTFFRRYDLCLIMRCAGNWQPQSAVESLSMLFQFSSIYVSSWILSIFCIDMENYITVLLISIYLSIYLSIYHSEVEEISKGENKALFFNWPRKKVQKLSRQKKRKFQTEKSFQPLLIGKWRRPDFRCLYSEFEQRKISSTSMLIAMICNGDEMVLKR